jgi:hypothetical protein
MSLIRWVMVSFIGEASVIALDLDVMLWRQLGRDILKDYPMKIPLVSLKVLHLHFPLEKVDSKSVLELFRPQDVSAVVVRLDGPNRDPYGDGRILGVHISTLPQGFTTSVRSLYLINASFSSVKIFPFRKLEVLRIEGPVSITFWMSLTEMCPALESVTLDFSDWEGMKIRDASVQPTILPCLVELDMTTVDDALLVNDILTYSSIPILQTLRLLFVSCTREELRSGMENIQSKYPKLENLALIFRTPVSFDLIPFLTSLHSLRALDLVFTKRVEPTVRNSDLHALVSNMPFLRALTLVYMPTDTYSTNRAVMVDLEGLACLGEHCQTLQHLIINLDATDVRPTFILKPLAQLRSFTLCDPILHPTTVLQVPAVLARLSPICKTFDTIVNPHNVRPSEVSQEVRNALQIE